MASPSLIKEVTQRPKLQNAVASQGSQFRTEPADMANVYRIGQCTGIDNPSCFVSEKIPTVPQNPAVSASKWIPGKDREIPKKNSHEFSELTQSCCTWPETEPEPEPEPEPLCLLPLPSTQTHRSQPLKT